MPDAVPEAKPPRPSASSHSRVRSASTRRRLSPSRKTRTLETDEAGERRRDAGSQGRPRVRSDQVRLVEDVADVRLELEELGERVAGPEIEQAVARTRSLVRAGMIVVGIDDAARLDEGRSELLPQLDVHRLGRDVVQGQVVVDGLPALDLSRHRDREAGRKVDLGLELEPLQARVPAVAEEEVIGVL